MWQTLGGGELRRGRGQAFFRDGDGYNVSLNDEKGTWFDFVTGEGGGVLDLVCKACGCDRKTALAWLADSLGLSLNHNQATPEQRRAWRQAEPGLTAAMLAAGMAAERRAQTKAAEILMETTDAT